MKALRPIHLYLHITVRAVSNNDLYRPDIVQKSLPVIKYRLKLNIYEKQMVSILALQEILYTLWLAR